MSHDDFKFEPVRGFPEALPAGLLTPWLGSPPSLRFSRHALGLPCLPGSFSVLSVWPVGLPSSSVSFG